MLHAFLSRQGKTKVMQIFQNPVFIMSDLSRFEKKDHRGKCLSTKNLAPTILRTTFRKYRKFFVQMHRESWSSVRAKAGRRQGANDNWVNDKVHVYSVAVKMHESHCAW